MFEHRIGEDPHRRDYGRTKQGQKVRGYRDRTQPQGALRKLAKACGINAGNLKKQVESFNKIVEKRKDPEFKRFISKEQTSLVDYPSPVSSASVFGDAKLKTPTFRFRCAPGLAVM